MLSQANATTITKRISVLIVRRRVVGIGPVAAVFESTDISGSQAAIVFMFALAEWYAVDRHKPMQEIVEPVACFTVSILIDLFAAPENSLDIRSVNGQVK
jgi:hypothetical protein